MEDDLYIVYLLKTFFFINNSNFYIFMELKYKVFV